MEEKQVDYDQSAEDEAFLASMSDDAEAPQKEPEVIEEVEEVENKETQETEEGVEEVERVEVIPGFTAEELKNQLAEIPRLQKALDTTNGTYGKRLAEQQKLIDSLSKSGRTDEAKQVAKLNPDSFKRLKEEFPEFADLFVQDFSEIMAGNGAEDIDSHVTKALSSYAEQQAAKEAERNIKRLTKRHPDWKEVAAYKPDNNGLIQWADPKFGQWVANQSQEVQNEIINSDDPDDLIDYLDQYKGSLTQEVKQTSTQKVKTTPLEKAIQPKSKKGEKHMSDKEAEEAAFRAAMKDDNYF